MEETSALPHGAAHEALTARWHLAVVGGPDPGWCLPVRRRPADVGRDPAADLVLDDPRVSRRHLQVRERRGWVEVRDLGSANGTRMRRAYRSFPWARGARASALRTVLGRRWRRVAAGSDLLVGGSVLRVRARPGLAGAEAPEPVPRPPTRARTGPAFGRMDGARDLPSGLAHGDGHPPRSTAPLLLALSGLPFLMTSAVTGSRLAAFAAVPVLVAVAAARYAKPRSGKSAVAGDPAAVLLRAARGSVAAGQGAPVRDRTGTRVEVGGTVLDPFVEGPLALVGPVHATRAAGRWLVAQLITEYDEAELAVVLEGACAEPWASTLPHASKAGAAARVLTLLEGHRATTRPPSGPGAPPARRASVVVVDRLEQVPPWCRRVVEVPPSDDHLVSSAWARRLVAALTQGRAPAAELPSRVAVTDLLADPGLAWPSDDGRLAAAFCVGAAGPLLIDLARDGPHALVAGTSGSGKSELLLCWVLALACRYPPSALTVVAIDYKGGATFGALADLPHVDALLTDLDAAGTARALAGLRSELARRERLLAGTSARDLDEYRRRRAGHAAGDSPPPNLPRLLVVVDEFRALADEHPDLLAGLVRLAAQGRSLGIHLILATQRPAGAVSADLRANLGVTVCLRVLTGSDSRDVLGCEDAARLPALPGRAFVRGVDPVTDAVRAVGGTGPASGVGETMSGSALSAVQGAWSVSDAALAEQVGRIVTAARRHGHVAREPLWAPPLPTHVRAEEHLPEGGQDGAVPGLPLLLTDPRGGSRLAEWAWSPLTSALLVAGGSATGRSTALLTAATAAANRGWTVHLIHGTPAKPGGPWAALAARPEVGTVVGADDPRRLVRLLELLEDMESPALLCVDDVEPVIAAVDRMRGAPGNERLARLLRDGRTSGLGVVISGSVEIAATRWAAAARQRILLGPLDSGQAALAGIPRDLVLSRPPVGRGVLVGDGPPVQAQVLLPPAHAVRSPAHRGRGLPRLAPVPLLVTPDELLARWAGSVPTPGKSGPSHSEGPCPIPLGLGGDTGDVVPLDLATGARVVVAGPPESGRSSVLRWIGECLRVTGRDALLVDDADLLPLTEGENVARQWRERAGSIVVTVRTDALAGAYAGVLGLLRESRQVLLLAPLRGGLAHLSPVEVLPHADPGAPRHPGRGVLVTPRRSTIVQAPRW